MKQIGDEFMLVFPLPGSAIAFGVAIHAAAADEHQFPALRSGAHVGPVLFRAGDYLGATVNLTARVTAVAERDQFLVTGRLRQAAGIAHADVVNLGDRALKGVSDPVDLFEVGLRDRQTKAADPVCGMQLDERSAEMRLAWGGEELLFCSRDCLERFVSGERAEVPR
ncbi:hypothetical protein [Iamia sp.]|uniref:hypothetical protein n=1 Tax=Iamia sp. TaxID=2722710 RepID=UPI002C3D6AA1|nr:hypothetical protein [Iamia sp.]HXH59001.1 hypothetical protein [Iamia sp.]